jgi:hypothetical protein
LRRIWLASSLLPRPGPHRLLIEAYDELERAQGPHRELESVREWAAKAAEHARRIAGVLTLTADTAGIAVPAETMRGALTLMQYYLGEYVRVIGAADVSEEIRRAELLRKWLRQKLLHTVTPRQVMQTGPNSIRSADVARAALRTLCEHRWLSTENHRSYQVHPALFDEDGA